MGRKIPAKKHRGVKDPLVQQARRLETLKSKINAPPKDPDEQPVPRSLLRLFAFQEKGNKTEEITKKKIKLLSHGKDKQSARQLTAGHNPVSSLRRLPGESGRDFSLRINSAVKALHNPVEDIDYPQEAEAEDLKGSRMAAQRERRARKRKRAKKGDAGEEQQERPSRMQRLALKKTEKKLKALEARQEKQEVVYERVLFGDVTHAPPVLPTCGRLQARLAAAAGAGAPRPGRRDLLLTRMLTGAAGAGAGAGADAQRRERARLEAVAAYRAMKASKAKYKNK